MRDCVQEWHFCGARDCIVPYYEQDGITIYRADCLDVLPLLAKVDHVITDPPYSRDVYTRIGAPGSHPPKKGAPPNLGRTFKLNNGARIKALAAGAIGAVDDLIAPVSLELARLTQRWALVFSDAEAIHRWRADLEGAGMRYVRTGAWVKPDPMPQFSGDRPCVGFEPCTITHAQGPMRWNGGGKAAVWTYNTAKGDAQERPDHPCPKPLPLMRTLIEQFTDPGDLILDPFMGSGTTLRAAKDLGRRAIGIEVNEAYCKVAVERLRQAVLL